MKFSKFKIKLSLLDYVFAAFLLLAIYLRFYHFDRTYEWGADNVRDFLVAKHIVVNHDYKWIAPWAFGSNNQMVNSVFYFYFLAVFYFFSFGNVFIYQLLVALFFFISIAVFSYLLAKLFFKEKIAVYSTVLLFCFLPVTNVYGRSVFQPHFVLPFFSMSLYYYFSAFKRKSIRDLFFATLFYSAALHLHYSMLVVLPWIIGMMLYLSYKIEKEKEKPFKWKNFFFSQLNWPNFILFLNFYFLILNQLVIRGFDRGFFSLGSFFNKVFSPSTSHVYFTNFTNNFHIFLEGLLSNNNQWFFLILIYSSIFLILILFFLQKKTFYSLSLFLSLLCLPGVFLITYRNGDMAYPSYYFSPFYILVPDFLLSILASLSKKWRNVLLLTILFSFFAIYFEQFGKIKLISNHDQIRQYHFVADLISNDAKKNLPDPGDFFIFTIDDQLDWSSSNYWYYLEENLQLSLVETTWFRYNLISAKEKSQTIYLICDNPRVSWDRGRENWCLERLDNKNYFLTKDQVFLDEQKNLVIYRVVGLEPIGRYSLYGLISSRSPN